MKIIKFLGAVFGWGKNTFGQLGLNDTQDRNLPCQLQTLQNAKICYAACGEEFSVFLTVVSISIVEKITLLIISFNI